MHYSSINLLNLQASAFRGRAVTVNANLDLPDLPCICGQVPIALAQNDVLQQAACAAVQRPNDGSAKSPKSQPKESCCAAYEAHDKMCSKSSAEESYAMCACLNFDARQLP